MRAEFRKATKETHTAQLARWSEKTTTLIVGDSILERLVWFSQKEFPAHMLVLAKGGDRISHLLWRLEHTPSSPAVEKIFLQIGTNNLLRDPPARISAGILQVVQVLRDKFPAARIFVGPIYPCSDGAQPIPMHTIHSINTVVAAGLQATVGQPTSTPVPAVSFEASFWAGIVPTDHFEAGLYTDHVHLSRHTNERLYAQLLRLLL